jgi:RHS repeat-associated protein
MAAGRPRPIPPLRRAPTRSRAASGRPGAGASPWPGPGAITSPWRWRSPWRFQGRILESADGSTDLYDFQARSYDPSLGAFTSFDSVTGSAQNPVTLNRYLYANANPATLVDPDGHAVPIVGVLAVACLSDPLGCAAVVGGAILAVSTMVNAALNPDQVDSLSKQVYATGQAIVGVADWALQHATSAVMDRLTSVQAVPASLAARPGPPITLPLPTVPPVNIWEQPQPGTPGGDEYHPAPPGGPGWKLPPTLGKIAKAILLGTIATIIGNLPFGLDPHDPDKTEPAITPGPSPSPPSTPSSTPSPTPTMKPLPKTSSAPTPTNTPGTYWAPPPARYRWTAVAK